MNGVSRLLHKAQEDQDHFEVRRGGPPGALINCYQANPNNTLESRFKTGSLRKYQPLYTVDPNKNV